MKAKKSDKPGGVVIFTESHTALRLGKPATEVTRVFLARADVSQLKEQYSGEAGERFAKAIRENCTAWFQLKQNKEHK
ncbi:hypothetical protein QRZ34_28165 [Klebsiella michiganensis]|uniref:hypothetical protein n=1 Tax=Klebsiella michiganensis TaxID=1134687 RepID=UPI002238A4AF|nr:hypothetical protein [Klebsiella michiganensis]MDL4454893.1 hypothetical protein [Klebsiella michiganensis]